MDTLVKMQGSCGVISADVGLFADNNAPCLALLRPLGTIEIFLRESILTDRSDATPILHFCTSGNAVHLVTLPGDTTDGICITTTCGRQMIYHMTDTPSVSWERSLLDGDTVEEDFSEQRAIPFLRPVVFGGRGSYTKYIVTAWNDPHGAVVCVVTVPTIWKTASQRWLRICDESLPDTTQFRSIQSHHMLDAERNLILIALLYVPLGPGDPLPPLHLISLSLQLEDVAPEFLSRGGALYTAKRKAGMYQGSWSVRSLPWSTSVVTSLAGPSKRSATPFPGGAENPKNYGEEGRDDLALVAGEERVELYSAKGLQCFAELKSAPKIGNPHEAGVPVDITWVEEHWAPAGGRIGARLPMRRQSSGGLLCTSVREGEEESSTGSLLRTFAMITTRGHVFLLTLSNRLMMRKKPRWHYALELTKTIPCQFSQMPTRALSFLEPRVAADAQLPSVFLITYGEAFGCATLLTSESGFERCVVAEEPREVQACVDGPTARYCVYNGAVEMQEHVVSLEAVDTEESAPLVGRADLHATPTGNVVLQYELGVAFLDTEQLAFSSHPCLESAQALYIHSVTQRGSTYICVFTASSVLILQELRNEDEDQIELDLFKEMSWASAIECAAGLTTTLAGAAGNAIELIDLEDNTATTTLTVPASVSALCVATETMVLAATRDAKLYCCTKEGTWGEWQCTHLPHDARCIVAFNQGMQALVCADGSVLIIRCTPRTPPSVLSTLHIAGLQILPRFNATGFEIDGSPYLFLGSHVVKVSQSQSQSTRLISFSQLKAISQNSETPLDVTSFCCIGKDGETTAVWVESCCGVSEAQLFVGCVQKEALRKVALTCFRDGVSALTVYHTTPTDPTKGDSYPILFAASTSQDTISLEATSERFPATTLQRTCLAEQSAPSVLSLLATPTHLLLTFTSGGTICLVTYVITYEHLGSSIPPALSIVATNAMCFGVYYDRFPRPLSFPGIIVSAASNEGGACIVVHKLVEGKEKYAGMSAVCVGLAVVEGSGGYTFTAAIDAGGVAVMQCTAEGELTHLCSCLPNLRSVALAVFNNNVVVIGKGHGGYAYAAFLLETDDSTPSKDVVWQEGMDKSEGDAPKQTILPFKVKSGPHALPEAPRVYLPTAKRLLCFGKVGTVAISP